MPDIASASDLTARLLSYVSGDPMLERYVRAAGARYAETCRILTGVRADSVLDIGSKAGVLLPALREVTGATRLAYSDGFDSPPSIRTFRSTSGPSFDAERFGVNLEEQPLPFADESFDVVTCLEVIEHLVRDPLHLLLEIGRVLKPRGTLLISTPNIASILSIHRILGGRSPSVFVPYRLDSPYERHNREYTLAEVRRIVETAGFDVKESSTDFGRLPGNARLLARIYRATGVVRQPVRALGQISYVLAEKTTTPSLDSLARRYPHPFYFVEDETWLRESGLATHFHG